VGIPNRLNAGDGYRRKKTIINGSYQSSLNVLILVMDSVSRIAAENQFSETLHFLEHEMGGVAFKHHNIIGINSIPNAVCMLTGKLIDSFPAVLSLLAISFRQQY
jgi:hypothetical protein